MSDIADRADGCEAVTAAGGVFTARNRGGPVPVRILPPCSCGGRASYAPHPPLGRYAQSVEVLRCLTCGNSVGPMAGRQTLAEAWRMGGYQAQGAKA